MQPYTPSEGLIIFVTVSFLLLIFVSQIILLTLNFSFSNLVLFFSIISIILTYILYFYIFIDKTQNSKNKYPFEISILLFGLLNITCFISIGFLISFR
jgi:membrane protein implicated in regulation of membrane protease activity